MMISSSDFWSPTLGIMVWTLSAVGLCPKPLKVVLVTTHYFLDWYRKREWSNPDLIDLDQASGC